MKNLIKKTANAVAMIGILICILSGLLRVFGNFYIAGFELLTLYNIGIGLMVFSGLLKLDLILKELRESN